MNRLWCCPVCGHRGLASTPYATWPPPAELHIEPPYNLQLGRASYEVCVRCGFEFGNDDDPGEGLAGDSFPQYLADWQAQGRPWLGARYESEHHGLDDAETERQDCPACLRRALSEGRPLRSEA